MHRILFNYISAKAGMTLQEFEEEIQPIFTPQKFEKKTILLKQGEICNFVGFCIKGLTRTYSVDDQNQKHILSFGFENYWITERESYALDTPSEHFIQTLEESEILMAKKSEFEEMIESNALFRTMITNLKEANAIVTYHKVVSMKHDSAELKYQKFMKKFHEITQRIPQHMIASYLGIKPETLSRIRKNPNRNK